MIKIKLIKENNDNKSPKEKADDKLKFESRNGSPMNNLSRQGSPTIT